MEKMVKNGLDTWVWSSEERQTWGRRLGTPPFADMRSLGETRELVGSGGSAKPGGPWFAVKKRWGALSGGWWSASLT